MENNVKLSAPWVSYFRQLEALFKYDESVNVKYNEAEMMISVYVEGQDKADALTQLLPTHVVFGNVTVRVNVIPANNPTTRVDLLKKAFDGNPIFSYAATIEGVMVNPISYVVFEPKVAQYWDDNLHNPHGMASTLYEDIARNIFGESEGICFTTDSEEPQAIG